MPYTTLCSEPVLRLLRDHGLQVLVAVAPGQVSQLGGLTRSFGDAGVELGLWPMVADSDGRWGSTFNAQLFADFVMRVVDASPDAHTIAIDLEPPIAMVQGLLAGRPEAYRGLMRSDSWAPGHAILDQLLGTLSRGGYHCLAAANPMLLGDGRGESAWQWLFGTPIDELPFDAVSFMTYTSLIEGYSRGLINRRIARSMLAQTASAARVQWGSRASLSIGTVGGGALGDERPYRSLRELEEDVAVARACGVEDLALFDLSGVLTKPDPQAWIRAFADTPAATSLPASPRRARLLKAGIKQSGSAIGWYRRLRRPGQ